MVVKKNYFLFESIFKIHTVQLNYRHQQLLTSDLLSDSTFLKSISDNDKFKKISNKKYKTLNRLPRIRSHFI